MKNIILIGFMGSGKTSVARKIASLTKLKLEDIDLWIVKSAKMEIKEIFEKFGEAFFRKLETKTAKKVCALKNRVISTGGGIVTKAENFKLLKSGGTVVYLKNSFATSTKRLEGKKDRPLFDLSKLQTTKLLFNSRLKLYKKVAEVIVSTDNKSVLQVAKEVIKKSELKVENNKLRTKK
ncbi:MAG: shikimate kinase [bacterium]